MRIDLDKNASFLIETLIKNGFDAYAVGGCVRDYLLSRPISDVDITTSALPEETKKVFSPYPVIETGIKHGTVTVVLDKKPYEITTFRVESGYTDKRHPDSVSFVKDVRSDLSRRDFTVNAMAYNENAGLVDYFGGISDLKNKIIRTVGDPAERFSEDALRILRALRFASVLGFSVEKETKNSCEALAETLLSVSSERIFAELKKLVCGVSAKNVIDENRKVLSVFMKVNPDISKLDILPKDHSARLAYLCGESVTDLLAFLKADNETKRKAKLLVNSAAIPKELPALKKYISALGREDALYISAYRRAVYCEDAERMTETLCASSECLTLSDLKVNGSDLLSLGVPDKKIGEALKSLLDAVLAGEIKNEKELLLKRAKALDI